jgi:hypothetical protein
LTTRRHPTDSDENAVRRRSTSVGKKDPHNAYPVDANIGTPPMPADSDKASDEERTTPRGDRKSK